MVNRSGINNAYFFVLSYAKSESTPKSRMFNPHTEFNFAPMPIPPLKGARGM